jgi:hypothetical protein
VSEIKGDSQAYELAKQRTLLPGERELLAESGATGRRRSASQGLPVLGAFRSRVRKYPSASLSAGPYFALGDTNVFARPTTSGKGANMVFSHAIFAVELKSSKRMSDKHFSGPGGYDTSSLSV